MSTVTRWWTDALQTPFTFIPSDFIVHINIGTIANLGAAGVDRHSGVWATICEVMQPSGEPLDFPFIGAAPFVVENIAAQDDGTVLCRIGNNWNGVLNFKLQFLVCND